MDCPHCLEPSGIAWTVEHGSLILSTAYYPEDGTFIGPGIKK
jgi:hypothetical protein